MKNTAVFASATKCFRKIDTYGVRNGETHVLTDDGLGRRKLPKVVDPQLVKYGMPANLTVNTGSDQGDSLQLE